MSDRRLRSRWRVWRARVMVSTVVLGAMAGVGYGSEHDSELPRSEARELTSSPWSSSPGRRRVRVRGVVSGLGEGIVNEATQHPARRGFCVEDETGGIWVSTKPAIRQGLFEEDRLLLRAVQYGVEVEVVGVLERGTSRPIILPTQISVLGEGRLQPAAKAELSSFLSGGDEMRRVTVSGVVQEVTDEATRDNRWVLRIETGIGHFFVRVLKGPRYSPQQLLDAKLQVTGLVTSSRNWRWEFVCPRLIVRRHEDIQILEEAPADPYSVPAVPLGRLNGYSAEGLPVHRRRVVGTVTYNDRRSLLYIQQGSVGVRVHTSEPSEVRVGDRVEVSGFIDTTQYLSGLRGAVVRRLDDRDADPVEPVAIASTAFSEYQQRVLLGLRTTPPSTSVEGRLTQLTGAVLSFRKATTVLPNAIEIRWGDSITTALVPGHVTGVVPGAEVTVTGVARVSSDVDRGSVKSSGPTRVDLLLRSPSDLVVVNQPSWWTAQRIMFALAIALTVAVAAFSWAFALRRLLTVRTEQLALEVRNRRDAAIEFQAAMRERTRLAVDLHDTVLQTMAGIAFQIDACRGGPQDVSLSVSQQARYLETAERMARNGQEDLRNVVWALRCLPLQGGTLLDAVEAIAAQVSQRFGIRMSVESDGPLPQLADFVAGNLLLIIQEASHNAVKHAQADHIRVALSVNRTADRVSVSVSDNGVGFDVAARPSVQDGHFGIDGMEQRIQRVGGALVIKSEVSVGTEIRAEVPIRTFDAVIA